MGEALGDVAGDNSTHTARKTQKYQVSALERVFSNVEQKFKVEEVKII